MKVSLHFLKLLKTNLVIFLVVIFCVHISAQTNTGIIVNGGMLVNKTLCNKIKIVNTALQYTNSCTGEISYSYELGAKLKYSKHFSVEFGYQSIKQHVTTEFKNLDVYCTSYSRHFPYTVYAGNVSYKDEIFLNSNHYYVAMNFEFTKGGNNFILGGGLSEINYGSEKSYITRNYSKLPENTYLPTNTSYKSPLDAPRILGFNLKAKYERMLYKKILGIYFELAYRGNFFSHGNLDYEYRNLGFDTDSEYRFVDEYGGYFYNIERYQLTFNAGMISAGLFYKFNFKEHEKNSF